MAQSTAHFRRVRKDHTCISLQLFREDSDLCQKCYKFRQRQLGISGRKPGKNATPNCEKPWSLTITDTTESRLIKKKEKAIEVLHSYCYKVTDDVTKKITSRNYDRNNYRDSWKENDRKKSDLNLNVTKKQKN